MSHFTHLLPTRSSFMCFCSCALMVLFISCGAKKEKQAEVINEDKTKTDSLAKQPVVDTPITQPTPSPTQPVKPTVTDVPPPLKPKICDVDLKLIASPKKDQKIYYITGLVPDEFKCWVDLENYSIKLCNGSACVLYFVDIPNPKVSNTPPHFLDAGTLSTHGVGLFEYNGSNWTMRGANIWGRKEKGYGYYNTDNAGGG